MKIQKKIIAAGLIIGMTGNMAGTALAADSYADAFELPELTGDQRDDIIAIAESQLGYTEAEDGSTIFGAWAGDATQAWCSEFAAWCAYKAGIPESIFPKKRSSNGYQKFYAPKGRFFFLEGGVIPEESSYWSSDCKTIPVTELEKGDILLVEVDGDPSNGADHTGLFLEFADDRILYISGNANDSVLIGHKLVSQIHGVCKPAYKQNTPVASSSNGEHEDNSTGTGGSSSSGSHSGSSGKGSSSSRSSGSSTSAGPSSGTLKTTGGYLYEGTWVLDQNGWKLRKTDGSFAGNQWAYINGKWYVFGTDGYMLTGWQNIDGFWYYLHESGAMQTGWIFVNNKWYCLASNGVMYASTTTPDGYLVDSSGAWVVSN